MHGLIFETSVCYWQNQPGCYLSGKWIAYNECHWNNCSELDAISDSLQLVFFYCIHAPHDRSQKKVSYVKLALVSHSFQCLNDTSSSHLIDSNSLLGFGFIKVHKCFFQSDLIFALSMYRQRRLFWPAVPINSLCCERLTETSLIEFL
jgi:hypothetical protein